MRSLPHRVFLELLAKTGQTSGRLANENVWLLEHLLANGEAKMEIDGRELTLFLFLAEKSPTATEPLIPFSKEA